MSKFRKKPIVIDAWQLPIADIRVGGVYRFKGGLRKKVSIIQGGAEPWATVISARLPYDNPQKMDYMLLERFAHHAIEEIKP